MQKLDLIIFRLYYLIEYLDISLNHNKAKQMISTFKNIFWRQGSGVEDQAGVAGADVTGKQRSHKMGQGEMGISILGQIQVIPRWSNDPVCINNRNIREGGQGWVQ